MLQVGKGTVRVTNWQSHERLSQAIASERLGAALARNAKETSSLQTRNQKLPLRTWPWQTQ
jgi:hypothetical protein